MLNFGVCGAEGRIGQILVENIVKSKKLSLCAAIVEAGSHKEGEETGKAGVLYESAFPSEYSSNESSGGGGNSLPNKNCASFIDFSIPTATMTCLAHCIKHSIPLVIGTTGHSKQQLQSIRDAGKQIPVLQAANMSAAVTACFMLIERAVAMLGEEYDIEIVEAHHKHKIDAPSGTALEMGKSAAKARGKDLSEVAVSDRSNVREARSPGSIGMQAIRGGGVVGEHEIFFIGDNETVSISHKAYSREIFASGALRAAKWLAQKKSAGLYTMEDVLNSGNS